MEDELQEVRDNFFAGNFAKVLSLCEGTHASNDLSQAECDAINARCNFSLGKWDQLKAMQNSDNPGQKATALLAVIVKSPKEEARASAKEHLVKLAKETQDLTCNMLAAIVAATEGSYSDAVSQLKAHPTLEMQALAVFFCLMCNQVAMADKMLKEMSGTNDDSVAFRMASAAVKMATGDPEEAYLTYCDLSAQFPPEDGDDSGFGSVLLQTGKAVANMQRGMFTEALEDLQKAYSTNSKDVDVLVNLCSCATNLRNKAEFSKYYGELEQIAPSHPYVAKTQAIAQVFQRFNAQLA
eukprot:TRINITY_DN95186_c0_g1_i1.p1 TRINITY_DN95186_c0_g1~~TRINITY_DN95186_c0_g1_i1.p1  ORF type:complete len:296 (-),score=92.73 TRINITY_DN95186_c0_g1_i1:165-1052(-)